MRNREIRAVVAALIAGIALGCGESPAEGATHVQQNREITATVTGEAGVKNTLSDPGSAQFRNEHIVKNGDALVLCGEVNAKNQMGGYTGFVRFVAGGDAAIVSGGQLSTGDFAKLWEMSCSHPGGMTQ